MTQPSPADSLDQRDDGDEWQPIETAPRDGTYILVSWRENPAVNRLHIYKGKWTDGHGEDVFMTPTHWMPLPEPPK